MHAGRQAQRLGRLRPCERRLQITGHYQALCGVRRDREPQHQACGQALCPMIRAGGVTAEVVGRQLSNNPKTQRPTTG